MKKSIVVCAGLMGFTLALSGCSTEPSGGKLPPPPAAQSDEEQKASARKLSDMMGSHMKGVGGAPAPANPAKDK